jgi:hypothetical protein
MTEHSMVITGFCALLLAGALFRLARPPMNRDTGMMEGYFYVQSASYAGTGSRAGLGEGVSDGSGTVTGVRSGTGASTSRFGTPISAMTLDRDDGLQSVPGAATPWTNEAMGYTISTQLTRRT